MENFTSRLWKKEINQKNLIKSGNQENIEKIKLRKRIQQGKVDRKVNKKNTIAKDTN